tara:strand:+ start:1503 stop:1625 length:123 start_codon:yes stop_codon:yes gene_type:complete
LQLEKLSGQGGFLALGALPLKPQSFAPFASTPLGLLFGKY